MDALKEIGRRFRAWRGHLTAALHFLRQGPAAHVARLRELRRQGCLRVSTPTGDAPPQLLSLIFADGDLLTKVTPAGLPRWDEHRRALADALADLRATPRALSALAPLLLLPGTFLLLADLARLADASEFTRDLVVLALPPAIFAGARALLKLWIRRRLAADE